MDDTVRADAPLRATFCGPRHLTADEIADLHQTEFTSLTRFLLFQGATWNEAQDSAQDAFAELCRCMPAVSSPRAWLRTVAYRCWLKRPTHEEANEEIVHRTSPTTHSWQSPAEALELTSQQRYVAQLLIQLPPKQRAAMAWHLDGFTTKEIARELRTSPGAVLQNLSRARNTLKQALASPTSKFHVRRQV
ncbi:RNA polymerase sigma factor [Streptomyces platensis]|uniref:RNA polymerase sigma factor n=1 Tax=Streptomyces platensis TaxID=58346 RepID=UPI003C2C0E15